MATLVLKENTSDDFTEMKRRWGWTVAAGVVLTILGFVATGTAVFTTLISVSLYGWFLMGAAIVEVFHAFTCRKWKGFFLDLMFAILYGIAGFTLVTTPGASAVLLTFLIGPLFMVGGIFKVVGAFAMNHPHWGPFFNGVVTFILGAMILRHWPSSGLWVIGMFIGIEMLIAGIGITAFGFAIHNETIGNEKRLAA